MRNGLAALALGGILAAAVGCASKPQIKGLIGLRIDFPADLVQPLEQVRSLSARVNMLFKPEVRPCLTSAVDVVTYGSGGGYAHNDHGGKSIVIIGKDALRSDTYARHVAIHEKVHRTEYCGLIDGKSFNRFMMLLIQRNFHLRKE